MDSTKEYDLERFVKAQEQSYEQALQEVTDGYKSSHWIWYIFPQLATLGMSYNSKYYGLSGVDEAKAYLNHPVLGERLRTITNALLAHQEKPAQEIFGGLDAMKVRSCMTLFDAASPNDNFKQVLDTFYNGIADKRTLEQL